MWWGVPWDFSQVIESNTYQCLRNEKIKVAHLNFEFMVWLLIIVEIFFQVSPFSVELRFFTLEQSFSSPCL